MAMALREWVSMQDRVYRVVAPLLIDNTELCPRHVRNLLGLTAKTKYSYGDDFAPEAESALGLDDSLRVMSVLPGSGASLAGVQTGDVLLAVEIEPLPQGQNAEHAAAAIVSSEMQGRSALHMTFKRDDIRMAIDIPLTSACAMAIEVGDTDRVNSYADGHRILVTRGMLQFVRNDEELAYVLAKEIAHNLLMPFAREDMGAVIDRLREPGLPPPVPGIDAGIKPYSPVMDATADKLSLYLLARAGYGIETVLPFWERLAAAYPADIADSHTALHPSSNYRFSVMKEITQVIDAKQRKHQPLVP